MKKSIDHDISYSTEEYDDTLLFKLSGRLDFTNASLLKKSFSDFINSGKSVVIDCDALSYIDSSGIGTLISFYTSLKKHNHTLALVHVKGSVLQVFKLTRLHIIFNMFSTLKDAVSYIKNERQDYIT